MQGTRVLAQNRFGKALFLLRRTYDADADSPCHSMDLSTGLSQIQTSAGARHVGQDGIKGNQAAIHYPVVRRKLRS